MTATTGTIRPLREQDGNHYTCQRCGIERKRGGGRGRTYTYCQDCAYIIKRERWDAA